MISRISRIAGAAVLVCALASCVAVPATTQAPIAASPVPIATEVPALQVASPSPTVTSIPALATALPSPAPTSTTAPATGALYSQAPKSSGELIRASWRDPDGSDTDQWVWDSFVLDQAASIAEVHWRGGYDPARGGSGGPVHDFSIAIFPSSAVGSEPNIAGQPLVNYRVGGNAGETKADVLGGVQTYDYGFALPAPFSATAGTKYWLQIEAHQTGYPDWGLSMGSGGDGRHYRGSGPGGEGYRFQFAPGDTTFTLVAK